MSEPAPSNPPSDTPPAPSGQAAGKVRHASEFKCCTCKTEQAVAFWPVFDPDIQSYPYCRKCLDDARTRLLISLYIPDALTRRTRKKRTTKDQTKPKAKRIK